MLAEKYILLWGLTSILASIVGGVVAALKNRHVTHWIGWCFLVPPMVIALFLIPALKEPRPVRRSDDDHDGA